MITATGRSTSTSDEGVLFGVLPTPTIGTELVTDGDFPTGTSAWTKTGTWATSGGVASATGDSSSQYLSQDIGISNSTLYQLTYEVVENSLVSASKTIALSATGGFGALDLPDTVGLHTVYVTSLSDGAADVPDLKILLSAYATSGTVKLDNISLKSYLASDMDFTRATTATYVNHVDIINTSAQNVPRIDYTGGGCPHILAEPQRENICLRSAEIDQATWVKSNANSGSAPVVTADQVTSPNGGTNGDKVVFDLNGGTAATDASFLYQTYTQASTTYTLSCYLKGAVGGENITFDFGGVEVNTVTLTTDWVRYTFTKAVTYVGSTTIRTGIRGGVTSSDNPTIYMWGCQLEEGSYATSYIPTTSLAITRNGDVFDRTGIADLINSAEGVLFIEVAALANDGTHRQISLSDGSVDNRISIGLSNVSNEVTAQIKTDESGSSVFSMNKSHAMTQTDFNKIAIRWKVDDFSLWLNGSEVDTDVSGEPPVGLDRLTFDRGDSSNWFFGKVKQIQVYKTALTDTPSGGQMKDLTT